MESSDALPPELARFWRTEDGLSASERAEAYGIDLSILDDNLRLMPGERLRRNDDAIQFVQELRRAARAGILTFLPSLRDVRALPHSVLSHG